VCLVCVRTETRCAPSGLREHDEKKFMFSSRLQNQNALAESTPKVPLSEVENSFHLSLAALSYATQPFTEQF
jgi:hypothetical protein